MIWIMELKCYIVTTHVIYPDVGGHDLLPKVLQENKLNIINRLNLNMAMFVERI